MFYRLCLVLLLSWGVICIPSVAQGRFAGSERLFNFDAQYEGTWAAIYRLRDHDYSDFCALDRADLDWLFCLAPSEDPGYLGALTEEDVRLLQEDEAWKKTHIMTLPLPRYSGDLQLLRIPLIPASDP
jgi:hypothetical protein